MALLHAGPYPATVKLTKTNNNNNLKLIRIQQFSPQKRTSSTSKNEM